MTDLISPLGPVAEGENPLQTPFSFWYDKKIAKKTDTWEFKGKLKKLTTFNTVEGFWRAYLYLKRPSALEGNVNLYLFREGPTVCPMWEAFPRGGCWILKGECCFESIISLC